jgi:hypothetical protein
VIHLLWVKQTANHGILSKLEAIYGGGIIAFRGAEKWIAAFNRGRTEVDDLPRPGRPHCIVEVDAVRVLGDEQRDQPQKGQWIRSLEIARIDHDLLPCSRIGPDFSRPP